ncbi:uncharacterized protein LOC113364088 isoform X2 [Ctenocephalides felis]|uniref:uncharacterized protein LOC113364088 isoform X2 n=1 Tax=Ctenocephalides felis TaxID=7515 RepID=UPI000E6E4D82|nr:uncharacterized protein LOC113364088 isoform X2 [Ctenocephalides felis]
MESNQECEICGCKEFIVDAGFYYCQECGTRAKEIQEIQYELSQGISTARVHGKKIKKSSSTKSKEYKLTSWEIYNYVLIGLVDELQKLGASEEFKKTTLQLWTSYLTSIDVAFTSTKKNLVPKLPFTFKNDDAEILYGRVRRKRKRKSANLETSSVSLDITSLDASLASKQRRLENKALIEAEYEAIAGTQQSDTNSVFNSSFHTTKSTTSVTSNGSVKYNSLARKEYMKKMTDKLSENGPISNYEGRAMAYIILILKLIFGLDDHTEYVISEKVNVLNNVFKEIDENHTPIFSWEHWSCFIEYRKLLISQKQLPSHLNSNTHANSKMFVTLWNKLKCSDELTDSKTEQLMTVMKKIFSDLKDLQCDKFNDVLIFEPSLTPYKDYFNVILEICKDIVLPENVICKHRQFDFSFFINGSKNQINLSDDNVTLRFKNKSSNKNLHIWNANEEIEYKYDKSYIHKLNRHEIVNIHPIGSMEWKIKLDNKFRKINDCDNNADQAKRRSLGLIKEFQDIQTMKHESNQEIEAIKCAKFGGSVDVKEFQNVIIEKTKFPDKSLDERCKKFKNIHSKLLLYKDKYKKITSGVCEGRKKWFMSPKVYNPLLDEQTLRLGQKILPDIIHNSSPEKNCGDHVINIPRPVSHYWVNHFSNSVPVTNILFESMETKFSSTFSWLLEECARVVEMSKFDLYNELIEIEQQLGLIQFPDRNRKTI